MNIEQSANCVLIIVRDYYKSLDKSAKKLYSLRKQDEHSTVLTELAVYIPIKYKNVSVLHQYSSKDGSYEKYINSLCLVEIRDIMSICIDQIKLDKNGFNKALCMALGLKYYPTKYEIQDLLKEFSHYKVNEIEDLQFPNCPLDAVKWAEKIINEIDPIVSLYKKREIEKNNSRQNALATKTNSVSYTKTNSVSYTNTNININSSTPLVHSSNQRTNSPTTNIFHFLSRYIY